MHKITMQWMLKIACFFILQTEENDQERGWPSIPRVLSTRSPQRPIVPLGYLIPGGWDHHDGGLVPQTSGGKGHRGNWPTLHESWLVSKCHLNLPNSSVKTHNHQNQSE